MKKLILWLLAIIIALGVVGYFNPGLVSWVRQQTGTAPQKTTVYKWQDEKGEWHVTDEPPPPGTKYQKQEYLHDTNVLPPVKQDKK